MIIKPLISEDEARQTSKLFQKCWQDVYKGILPAEFLDNIPENAWVKRFNESGRHNLIFEDDKNIVRAAVSYGCPRDTRMLGCGELMALYVEPDFQGYNVGKTLLNAAENELKKMGYGKIYLWCLDGNEKAQGFYEHFGWRNIATERFVEIVGKEYKYLLYQKNLRD
ncbi:GNAT family N-acetyltransferase [Lactobacillus amylovorus]|uniref:GNAT family N-acetyltransferase n=1 Tax=Lactobacillus amylovorus TaxID=1604 RepID=UPI0022E4B97E|nr:GNAT family N-acetyltransferase [Lactobacillus amylovorus]